MRTQLSQHCAAAWSADVVEAFADRFTRGGRIEAPGDGVVCENAVAFAEVVSRRAAALAVLRERSRIIGEMHDTLAHSFTGILMQIEAARELTPSSPSQADACLSRAAAMARTGLRQSRQIVSGLAEDRPASLAQAIAALVRDCAAWSEATCSFELTGRPPVLTADVDRHALRICQEAMSNAHRYAAARTIKVTLASGEGGFVLDVEDDGRGFVLAEAAGIGFGLSGMRKRAERIGGRLEIRSEPGQGARVRLIWKEPSC